jgi:hypothetical protein
MPLSFVVVCEAAPDAETACDLADRVLCAEVPWIAAESLDDYRVWRGLTAGDRCLRWQDVRDLARQMNLRAYGHFAGEPGAPDAHAGRRALAVLKHAAAPFDGVLLLRDDDRQPARRQGLEQARDTTTVRVPIIIGLAHTKRECWALAGFQPQGREEEERVAAAQHELGFDPCAAPELLTGVHDHELKSAKRLLRLLAGGDRDREADCWRRTDLAILENRGRRTGLADYLREVRERVIPLFKP